jgi:4-oxalmesaconate hydratase
MGTRWKSFDDFFRRFYFDTCVYTKDPLELLFKIAGPDRCLFGTEKPGSGVDPETGRSYDDVKPTIEGIGFLSDAYKNSIFEGNVHQVFNRIDKKHGAR